jgi:hypothetical protein
MCLACLAALDDSGVKVEIAVLVTLAGLAMAARERRAMRLIFAPPTGGAGT